MRFIGFDVHKRIVQACVLDANGVQLNMLRFNLTAETLAGFAQHHLDEDCALARPGGEHQYVGCSRCPQSVLSTHRGQQPDAHQGHRLGEGQDR